jgi:iron-sulfur cluster assembly protein
MDYKIEITEQALEKIKDHSKSDKENTFLRLGVAGAGCQGMSYVIKWDNVKNPEKDLVFNFNNIEVIIDNKSIKILNNCVLDYVKTLKSQSFVIKNPNQKSSCGCGKSFNT